MRTDHLSQITIFSSPLTNSSRAQTQPDYKCSFDEIKFKVKTKETCGMKNCVIISVVCRNIHRQHLFCWFGFLLLTAFKWCLYSSAHQCGSLFNLLVFEHCTHFRDGRYLPSHFTLLDSDLSVFWTVGPQQSTQGPWRARHMVSCGFRVSHRVVLLFHHIIRERRVVMNIHGGLVIQPVIRRCQMSRQEANVGETNPSRSDITCSVFFLFSLVSSCALFVL